MDVQLYQKWHAAGDGPMTVQEIHEMIPEVEIKLLGELSHIKTCDTSKTIGSDHETSS